jgi:hypothetical protein
MENHRILVQSRRSGEMVQMGTEERAEESSVKADGPRKIIHCHINALSH